MNGWSRLMGGLASLGLAFGCGFAAGPREPGDVLARSRAAMGSLDELGGPVVLEASGTLDKVAEGQGYSPSGTSPGPYEERLAFDSESGSVLWQYREDRFDGTSEVFGESFVGDLHRLFVIDFGIVVPFRGADPAADPRRIARRLPHALVAEVLERPGALDLAEERDSSTLIAGELLDGSRVLLEIDDSSGFLLEASHEAVLPGRGRAAVTWWFDGYAENPSGLWFPTRYGSTVGGIPYTDMTVDSLGVGDPTVFEGPPGLQVLPERPARAAAEPAPLDLEPLADGVFAVPDVRGGFAPLVIEFSDQLMVVDAPASFPLLGQFPPTETDPAPSMSWHAERLIDRLRERWPDKPVSRVILTHHHEDHVGGVRAFVAAGATVVGSPESLEVVERLVALPPDQVADRLAATPAELHTETLAGPHSLADGEMTVDLLPLEPNPHAAGLYVVSIPSLRALFVSDVVTPGPLDEYPRPNHRALDEAFAAWLARTGLDVQVIWTMHGSGAATEEHLEVLARSQVGGRGEPLDSGGSR